jgi:hypothetical protein
MTDFEEKLPNFQKKQPSLSTKQVTQSPKYIRRGSLFKTCFYGRFAEEFYTDYNYNNNYYLLDDISAKTKIINTDTSVLIFSNKAWLVDSDKIKTAFAEEKFKYELYQQQKEKEDNTLYEIKNTLINKCKESLLVRFS